MLAQPLEDATPPSRSELRTRVFGAILLVAAMTLGLVWAAPSVLPFGIGSKGPLPENLWPQEPPVPSTYWLTAESNQGLIRVWATAPDRWRLEDGKDGRETHVQVSTGTEVWDYYEPSDSYYSIPFTSAVTPETDVPHLQDGRPITFDLQEPSTRKPLAGSIGPTTSQTLMSFVESGHKYGSWSLWDSRYLGRGVQILQVEVKDVPRDSDAFPYEATFVIDPEFLFILAFEQTNGTGTGAFRVWVTEIAYNVPIPVDTYVFEPPEGVPNCLPPQFQDRCKP